MPSGFLNAPPSDSSSTNSEKGSRNKRKFRTDQQRQSASTPLAAPACLDSIVMSNCSNKDIPTADPALVTRTKVEHCNYGQHTMSNHLDYSSYHRSLQYGNFSSSSEDMAYSREDKEYHILQDSGWDRFSEAQLEEILATMLHVVYKNAIEKIQSCDFSYDEALNAVLRNGRQWNGDGIVANIVESSLAWLQKTEARMATTDPVFQDLKHLEAYVMSEMIFMVKKAKPYMSKGDAMWSLLMCDLNVVPACAFNEGDLSSVDVKNDATQSAVVPPAASASILPPSIAPLSNDVAPFLSPEYIACVNAETSVSSASCLKDDRSTFSTPGFSSSPAGRVSVASRKGVLKLSGMKSTNSKIINSIPENLPQNTCGLNSCIHSLLQIPSWENHSTNIGFRFLEPQNKIKNVEKSHGWLPDQLVANDNAQDTSSPEIQVAPFNSLQCMTQCSQTVSHCSTSLISVPEMSFEHDSSDFTGYNDVFPSVMQPFPQIQKPLSMSSTYLQGLTYSSGIISTSATEGVLPLTAVECSFATTFSSLVNVGKDVNRNDLTKMISSIPVDDNSSVNRTIVCTDTDSEERMAVMLWQIADRIKFLGAQVQEWSSWAQHKVMQAAWLLKKDRAELKSLRQERDEYIRMQKNKKTAEEMTMKKMSEIENALRKAVSQVDRVNLAAWRLESENAEIRAEIEAVKLAAAVSVSDYQEAAKRENKSSKKSQGWEKQRTKLQEDLLHGKWNLSNLLEQLSGEKKRLKQMEAKWRQGQVAKERALLEEETERKAKERTEQSAKRREETLQQKSEAVSQQYCDEVTKLKKAIANINLSLGLQPSSLSWESDCGVGTDNVGACSIKKLKQINSWLLSEISDLRKSQENVCHDRRCVMCMSEDMSVVYLPCAHQIVCVKCNELHQKQGHKECPSCRILILQRIQVYGVRS